MLSILYYLWCVPVITVFFLLSVIALIVCYPFDKGRRVVHELSRALCMVFWRTPPTWRRDVSGLENVEKGKPYVIVLNHNSMVDIISLYFVPLNFRWVSKREVFRIPFIGGLLVLHGDIAIERGRGAESMRKVIRDGRTWLSRGVSVAMFPRVRGRKTARYTVSSRVRSCLPRRLAWRYCPWCWTARPNW